MTRSLGQPKYHGMLKTPVNLTPQNCIYYSNLKCQEGWNERQLHSLPLRGLLQLQITADIMKRGAEVRG